MPKVSGSPATSLSRDSGGVATLKRNQACHQCRRRKLKCDAKRPCSTCVRSHSHAVAHAQEGSNLPSSPECTFDEVAPDDSILDASLETPRNRYDRLQRRILELEGLLKEKQDIIASFTASPVDPSQHSGTSGTVVSHLQSPAISVSTVGNFNNTSAGSFLSDSSIGMDDSVVFEAFHDLMGSMSPELGVSWPKWPLHLPRPDILRHIVDAFFAFHPHASRLLDRPTFLSSLSLPPSHPDFPSTPVLHAICATGSLYTVANSQQLGLNTHDFAEQQIAHAKNQIDENITGKHNLFQCLQATIILSWYYWSHARWIELFVCTGQSLRIAVPLGLNLCPPFHALNTTTKSMSIMPTPLDLAEDETRRCAFWLAYAIDRQYGAGNGWAMSLDDNDIAQLLPIPRAKLNAGTPLMTEQRQWSHRRESFLDHPPDITDSFTLYIKVMIIISHVKSFNHRFRIMESLEDPGAKTTRVNRWNIPDIRSTPNFSQLDDVVTSFRSSLSHEFKDPLANNRLDSHLYTAHLALHVSVILLHEPHAYVAMNICTSAMKILHAARDILDLVYTVWSTNYDLSHLDLFCPFCWFLAGRIFGRFLKAAQDNDNLMQVETLQIELGFIRAALGKMGEKVPLAARYQKMLDACILESYGPSISQDVITPVNGVLLPDRTTIDELLLSRVTQNQTSAFNGEGFMRFNDEFGLGDNVWW